VLPDHVARTQVCPLPYASRGRGTFRLALHDKGATSGFSDKHFEVETAKDTGSHCFFDTDEHESTRILAGCDRDGPGQRGAVFKRVRPLTRLREGHALTNCRGDLRPARWPSVADTPLTRLFLLAAAAKRRSGSRGAWRVGLYGDLGRKEGPVRVGDGKDHTCPEGEGPGTGGSAESLTARSSGEGFRWGVLWKVRVHPCLTLLPSVLRGFPARRGFIIWLRPKATLCTLR
jgi:hypothetical protein